MYKIEAIKKGLDILNKAKADLENLLGQTLFADDREAKAILIRDTVCEHFGITVKALKAVNRRRPIPDAKKLTSYFLNTYCEWLTDANIALLIGLERSSVTQFRSEVLNRLCFDKKFEEHYKTILMTLEYAFKT